MVAASGRANELGLRKVASSIIKNKKEYGG